MGAPVFADIGKGPADVIGDDYTTKKLLKVKCAPKSMEGPAFTIEDEVKGGAVEGKLTVKYVEPTTGITFDKLTLKGSTYGVEASKTISGVKVKAKVNPFDAGSVSASCEKKGNVTITAAGDKKKVAASVTGSPMPGTVAGFSFEYPVAGGPVALAAGASATLSGMFLSCVYTPKKVFNFGFMFAPMPKMDFAVTGDSTGPDSACVGIKWACAGAIPLLTGLGLKSTLKSLSLVCVKKFGKDASLVASATTKYEKMSPTFGAQLTIG